MTVQLSILIPALNESGNIKDLIVNLKNTLRTFTESYEIIVVDGGSTDGTQDLGRNAGARVLQQKSKGYGAALKESFQVVQGEYLITMDADFSHNPFFIQEMWQKRYESDVIIASRYASCGSSDAPLLRTLLSRLLNSVFTGFLGIAVKDISSGFRMYRRNILDSVTLISSDYDMLEEILVRLYCEGYSVKEIPFHYAARKAGRSKARIIRLAKVYLPTLFRMWKLRNSIQSADYDSRAYDSKLFPQRYWQRKRYAIIQDMIKNLHGTIVDIGCGSNRLIQNLSMLIGLDIRMSKLRFIKTKNAKLIHASACYVPLRGESCDGVVCSQVIEHIPQEQPIIAELCRILKKGGFLIIGTPDYGRKQWRIIEFLYKLILPNAYGDEHITKYSFSSLQVLLESNGFDIIEYRYIAGGELIVKAQKT